MAIRNSAAQVSDHARRLRLACRQSPTAVPGHLNASWLDWPLARRAGPVPEGRIRSPDPGRDDPGQRHGGADRGAASPLSRPGPVCTRPGDEFPRLPQSLPCTSLGGTGGGPWAVRPRHHHVAGRAHYRAGRPASASAASARSTGSWVGRGVMTTKAAGSARPTYGKPAAGTGVRHSDLAVELSVRDTPEGLFGAPTISTFLAIRDCDSVGIRRGGASSVAMPGNRLATAEAPTCCRPGH